MPKKDKQNPASRLIQRTFEIPTSLDQATILGSQLSQLSEQMQYELIETLLATTPLRFKLPLISKILDQMKQPTQNHT